MVKRIFLYINFSLFLAVISGGFISTVFAQEQTERKVAISKDLPYLDVMHEGKKIRIERNQDTAHRLSNSFAKTSRPCPPFCIQPMNLSPGIQTIGELELLDFLETKVNHNNGLLVDARMPDWFDKSTIPGSTNIPFTIFAEGLENAHTQKIIKLLGATEKEGQWDFSNTRELVLFCNGPWCGQSPSAIKSLIELGYPAEHLYWYRGGMQSWQLLGLTIVMP